MDWLTDTTPGGNQFNSIHDRLIEAWQGMKDRDDGPLHFCAMADNLEDLVTVEYLRDTATQAGFETTYLNVEDIGWNPGMRRFVDRSGVPILRCFKLYPWEWLVRDDFGRNVLQAPTKWLEPPWKMILSCKSILPLLYQMCTRSRRSCCPRGSTEPEQRQTTSASRCTPARGRTSRW